jgi:DNA-binding response OmpR family regulator
MRRILPSPHFSWLMLRKALMPIPCTSNRILLEVLILKHRNRSILCVEDDLDTCELMRRSLGMSGYTVVIVHSVEEGLIEARGEQYSLYSIDTNLPDGSGVDLCLRIREFDSNTPIIFYSADAYPSQIQRAMRAGAQAYLAKPTDPAILTKTIDCLLSRPKSRATSPGMKRRHTNEIIL